ncbi:MAG: hypothetical protein CK431_10250 [Mycobacterium sp.]|nr:MAG: hypothetical protein CK431_10250 [Mycobacterium sp.]
MSGLQSMPTVQPQGMNPRSGYVLSRGGFVPSAPTQITPGAVRVGAEAAARFLGVREETLRSWRKRGRGPAWYFHMGRIAYDVAVLEGYAAAQQNPKGRQ